MNGMSHKQAIRLIHRRQDGLLNVGQQSLLEEHLHSCSSCRAYAEEIEGMTAHLQDQFHRRWDRSVGPSQNVTENVMSKAGKIPVTNRISSGIRVAVGAMALLILTVAINVVVSRLQSPPPTTRDATETIDSSFLPEDRLLAFTSSQDGNSEIYTMHPDGSGLTNITNHPAHDFYPFWSPDGRQIAFMSDRGDSPQIYLMDADGSNVIPLTQGEGIKHIDVNGYSPWSPDGRELLYMYRSQEETRWNLYVLDTDAYTSTALTTEPGQYILPSWSPDGEHVAFTADTGGIYRDLFVVRRDGRNLVQLTENLQPGEAFLFDYDWSEDGTLIFTTSRNDQSRTHISTVYEAHMEGSTSVVAEITDRLIVDWWNGVTVQQQEEPILSWLRPDGSTSTLDVCSAGSHLLGTAHKRSQNGNMVFGSNCSDSGWMLFWANSDGTTTGPLLDSPIAGEGDVLFQFAWSPDDRYLAFVSSTIASSDITSTLYVLDVTRAREDSSTQPLKMTNSSGLSWQPVATKNLVTEEPIPDRTEHFVLDPRSCQPSVEGSVPSDLDGYDVVQDVSVTDGDFTFDFWLYCDPALQPGEQQNINEVAGLGIYVSWRFIGPAQPGTHRFYYEFEPGAPIGETAWDGPLSSASATGARFGIDLPPAILQKHIQQRTPIEFRIVVESPLGQKGATLSFLLTPSPGGLQVSDVWADARQRVDAGLIAFTAAIENGILDIYTMRPDGSELTNLTNNPAHEMNPHWSPDGKRIAFESDLYGFTHIFIMNADGSGVFQLTHGETQHQFSNSYPWSPDGSRLLYTEWTPEEEVWTLNVISADGQKKASLSQMPNIYTSSSWSPDGKLIAFISNDPQNPEALQMMIVDPDGENLADITSLLQKNERLDGFQYDWSPDGRSIFFTAYRHTNEGGDQWIAYEADLDNNRLIEKAASSTPMHSWWQGTAFITGFDLSTLTWMRQDGTYSTLNALEHCDMTANTQIGFLAKRSTTGDLLISVSCPNDDLWLYWAAADGSSIKQLLDSPLSEAGFELSGLIWSPDNEFIALNISSPNLTDMYILNVPAALSDPSIQPLRMTLGGGSMFYGAPSWQPAP